MLRDKSKHKSFTTESQRTQSLTEKSKDYSQAMKAVNSIKHKYLWGRGNASSGGLFTGNYGYYGNLNR